MNQIPVPFEEIDQAKERIYKAQNILIISHQSPDPDTIGANLALRMQLEAIGKNVVSACADQIPENCDFLEKSQSFVTDFNSTDFDLIITVDISSHELLKFHITKPELLDRTKTFIINIDHHPTNNNFGNINIVMPSAPAACFILYLFFSYYGWSITPQIATALLHGLYFDTGSFMHSNTSSASLRVAGRLIALGASHKTIVRRQFHTNTIPQLRVWGHALSRASFNSKNAIVTAITKQDFQRENANPDDLSGLINYINCVPEASFCMLLAEDMKGNIKGSMRTLKENIDLSQIASLFGGGGHKKAAGFKVPGELKSKIAWEIIEPH
ncbi:DHH family phosphoesterase [Patescibacteria group bacterium]|nr:DHH family phosphoesterase [Patescibacteria group bacterium]